MRNFVIASLVLHGVIGLFMVIGIKRSLSKSLINNQPLLIDFVEISEKSAAPKLAPVQKVEDIKTEAQITPEKPKESALDPQEPSPSTEKVC